MNKQIITQEDAASATQLTPYEGVGSLAFGLARAEIDQQVATAHAFPRSIAKATDAITTLATLSERIADECIYAVKRGSEIKEGPSIRLAEIIASQWGNCRVGARIIHVDRFEKFVEAQGAFHDLETGMVQTKHVRRGIRTKEGRLFSDDMIIVTGNAACAIATRNAIIAGVPRGVWEPAYEACEAVIIGDVKSISRRRASAIATLTAEYKVAPEQIFAALEIGGEQEIDGKLLVKLSAMRTAIKNGEATIDEMFPSPAPPRGSKPSGLVAELAAIAAAGKGEPRHDPVTGEIIHPEGSAARLEQTVEELEKLPDAPDAATGQSSATAEPSDPALQALMDEARDKAKGGAAIFKKWCDWLDAKDYALIKPHLDSFREPAIFADEARKSG